MSIDLLNAGAGRAAKARALLREGGRPAISVITYGALLDGVLRSRYVERDRARWGIFIGMFDVIDVTRPIADVWARVRGELRIRGLRVPDNDLIIASTAITLGLDLVTRNVRHFGRIGGLSIIDLS